MTNPHDTSPEAPAQPVQPWHVNSWGLPKEPNARRWQLADIDVQNRTEELKGFP